MQVFEMYVALWERAQAEGACVHYFDHPRADPPNIRGDRSGASGWFHANADIEDGQPVIQIYRLECDDDAFTPSRTRGPNGADLPPPDLEHELITLAHEYGHLISFLTQTPRAEWKRYSAAASKRGQIMKATCEEMPHALSSAERNERLRSSLHSGLDNEERDRIVKEEALAWKIGRQVLQEFGMADLSAYDRRTVEGLHAHRYRLGMDEAWPQDEHGLTSE